jgi:hypothetical protein
MPELYSEYDGLAEKWATPLHATSELTVIILHYFSILL